MQRIWIGTSGWAYKHWASSFYPKDWPKKDELLFYVTRFPSVEINSTFYRLPTTNMVKGWHQKAPEDFLFAVKGSRFITHIKRLKATRAALNKYFNRISPLKEHLGPILWQLPPNFDKKSENIKRLEHFLAALPKKLQHALEFRHPSWIETPTFETLREHNVANVWLSSQRMPMDFTITADFVYGRFHGLENGAAHNYTEGQLKPWASELAKAARTGKPCFVYFNNDLNTRAPSNAQTLIKLVGRLAAQPFAEAKPLASRSRRITRLILREPRSKRLRST